MVKWIAWVVAPIALIGAVATGYYFTDMGEAAKPPAQTAPSPTSPAPATPPASQPEPVPAEEWRTAELHVREGTALVSLDQLAPDLITQLSVDEAEGIATFLCRGAKIELLKGSPTVGIDGIFDAVTRSPEFSDGKVYIPVELVQKLFGADRVKQEGNLLSVRIDKTEALPTLAVAHQLDLDQASPQELADYLRFLDLPIKNGKVTKKSSQLPNAPRTYRNGVHEGLDWYDGFAGSGIVVGTPVYAMADGKVVRSDLGYKEFTVEERDVVLGIAAKAPSTPLWILDKLRGRTVWVQHDKGVLVRYAHLDGIPAEITPGTVVKKGQLIGYVGNSGTSYGVEKSKLGAHLHSDILVYGELFWKNLKSQDEIRNVLVEIYEKP